MLDRFALAWQPGAVEPLREPVKSDHRFPTSSSRYSANFSRAESILPGIHAVGHIPLAGERVEVEGWELTVHEMDKRRIARVLVRKVEDDAGVLEADEDAPYDRSVQDDAQGDGDRDPRTPTPVSAPEDPPPEAQLGEPDPTG